MMPLNMLKERCVNCSRCRNDAKIDGYDNFPNDSDDKKTEFADNMITIGALNFEYGDKVVARF
jgi:hypothetical protein